MASVDNFPVSAAWITRKLWWCAGADENFLLKSPKQDRLKYAGIGGIVFITGVLSIFGSVISFNASGSREITAGSDNSISDWSFGSVVFGLCVGVLIFFLYRFIVSITVNGEASPKMSFKRLIQSIPLLIFTILLGILIYEPLELKINESEINVELRKKQQEKLVELTNNTNAKFNEEIAQIDIDIKIIETDRLVLSEGLKFAEKEYLDQMQGRAGAAGFGPRSKQLLSFKEEKQKEVDDYDAKHNAELISLKSQREKKLAEQEKELNEVNKQKVNNMYGLMSRISVSHDLDFGWRYFLLSFLIGLLMLPIFIKMNVNKID